MTFEELLIKYNGGQKKGSQLRLATALHITEGTISHWINSGRTPDVDTRPRLAKILGVSIEELLSALEETKALRAKEDRANCKGGPGAVDHPPGAEFIQIRPIRVIGVVSAGSFDCPVDGPPDELLMISTPPGYKSSDVFGLRISGDCMEPTARSGDYAIIAKATEAHDGQLCIVRVDSECTFKRVFKKGTDCVELRPDNPKFKPIRVAAKHAHIVGKVLMFCRKP